MPQTGRPPLRVHAALLAVCYASLLLAVTVPHDILGCGHAPRPHCSACASLQSVPILAEPDHLLGDFAVLAVVDQRDGDALHAAVLARRADRERELAQAALEQHGVRPEGDDADGERGGKHGRGAAIGVRATGRCASGRIVGESRGRVNRLPSSFVHA